MLAIGVGGADCGRGDGRACRGRCCIPSWSACTSPGKLGGLDRAQGRHHSSCARSLTVKGGTNKIVEYFGPGAESISATGKGDDLQHGRRAGRDDVALPVRRAHGRVPARHRRARSGRAGRGVPPAPACATRRSSASSPKLLRRDRRDRPLARSSRTSSGPHSPDRGRPIGKLAAEVRENELAGDHHQRAHRLAAPTRRYEDMRRAAHVAMQALRPGLRRRPSSWSRRAPSSIYQTIKRDGHDARRSSAIGGTVLANACGPCIGQWKRTTSRRARAEHDRQLVQPQLPRAQRRQPARRCSFITQPRPGDRAARFAGHARLQPAHRHADGARTARRSGSRAPAGEELPRDGFARGAGGLREPRGRRRRRHGRVPIRTASGCSCSAPSQPWNGAGLRRPADPGQGEGQDDDRPHLAGGPVAALTAATSDKISDNMFLGAINALHRRDRQGRQPLTGETGGRSRRSRARLQGRGPGVGRRRRRELRRGLEPRARGDVAALSRRRGGAGAQLRAHPRDEPRRSRACCR